MIRLDIIIPNIQMSQLWEPVWSENKKLHPVIVIKVNYNIIIITIDVLLAWLWTLQKIDISFRRWTEFILFDP